MLELSSVRAGYGTFQALFDVSLQVRRGEAVAVIGPNGAGKTTLMRVVSGMIRPTAGTISMEGVDLVTTPAHRIVELGMAHVPESRRLFASMTVEENLKMGGVHGRRPTEVPPAPGLRLRASSPGCASVAGSAPAACRAASSRCAPSVAR